MFDAPQIYNLHVKIRKGPPNANANVRTHFVRVARLDLCSKDSLCDAQGHFFPTHKLPKMALASTHYYQGPNNSDVTIANDNFPIK